MRDSKGRFVKGALSERKGIKLSDEQKYFISLKTKEAMARFKAEGRKCGPPKGRPNPKIREVRLREVAEGKHDIRGEKNPMYGKKLSPEHRRKFVGSGVRRGAASNFWKGGVTSTNKRLRMESKHQDWRKAIFKRDNFSCQVCNVKGTYLEAHHIKSWSKYPELRYELDNGITLCRSCHNKTKWKEELFEDMFKLNLGRHVFA